MVGFVSKIAVLSNPRSTRNLQSGADLRSAASSTYVLGYAEPDSPDTLRETLRDFARHGVDVIAINGGDGTLREVLSALAFVDPDWLPALAIIPGGKTNLIANDVGSASVGERGLWELVAAAREGTLGQHRVRRPVLEIGRGDEFGKPIRGFFFGAGAFSRGTELAQVEAHAMGMYHGLAVAWTIGSMFVRSVRGHPFGASGDDGMMTLVADDGIPQVGQRFVVVATTLERIILKLGIFWDGQGGGAIRYTDIDGPPRRLVPAFLPVLRGRPKPWMKAAGYRSGRADRISLGLNSRFTLDGELFEPGPSGEILLSTPRSIDFVAP
ncbi:MAG: acylglycerol kinase family protein [Parvibaculum sp.]|uniref:diacylglycerol/lipid kinase family protein n=1 Tax=Parvibaculum sp. TaxID=2024848 RepID=UPI002ABAF92D|nr:acylglycerol kinase family protein [Parvibaculum sp.]MDZ4380588.1 acylglycerol kinase family protein [Parvibaculum sp.]